MLVAVGDAWPKSHALRKGAYTMKLMLRHHDAALLDGFKDLQVCRVAAPAD